MRHGKDSSRSCSDGAVGDPQAWGRDPASAWALVLPLCPHCLHMKLKGWTRWLRRSLIAQMFCDLVSTHFHMERLYRPLRKWRQIRVWWALGAPWNTCWNGVQGNLQIINGSGTSADSEVRRFFPQTKKLVFWKLIEFAMEFRSFAGLAWVRLRAGPNFWLVVHFALSLCRCYK